MAISANGFIASKDGSEDFLSHTNWVQFVKRAKQVGGFIYRKTTYESVITWGDEYLHGLSNVIKVVISTKKFQPARGFVHAASIEEALSMLEKKGLKSVLIAGGSTLNTEFIRKKRVDEIILDVNPTILGEGIPLLAPAEFLRILSLLSANKINDDIVEMHYKVKK